MLIPLESNEFFLSGCMDAMRASSIILVVPSTIDPFHRAER